MKPATTAHKFVPSSKREYDASGEAADLGQRFGYEAAHAAPLDWRHGCKSVAELAPALALAIDAFERSNGRPMRAGEMQACRSALVLHYGMAHAERLRRSRECGFGHGVLPAHLRAPHAQG